MGIISDPTCNYCEEGLETAAHFICECRHFAALCPEIWGNLIYTFLKLTQYRILWDSSKNHTDFRNTKVLRKSVWFLDVIIGILLGMAFGPTRQSRPTGLYEPCRWLEWNGINMLFVIASIFLRRFTGTDRVVVTSYVLARCPVNLASLSGICSCMCVDWNRLTVKY